MARRPHPQGKRLWWEMAASGQTLLSGSEAVFINGEWDDFIEYRIQ